MDRITTDVSLRGDDWERIVKNLYHTVFSTLYQIYVICTSVGIMYDKQISYDMDKDIEEIGSVPRTVLLNNKEEIEILFQTAILTSDNVNFDEDTRLELAFGDGSKFTDFNQMKFLTSYANYGAKILAEKLGDEILESLENIKNLLNATVAGLNFEINPIDIDELGISADDLLSE